MLPKIKSKSMKHLSQSAVTPLKNKQWDDKFNLERMPEYSPKKDPHIKKYNRHKNPEEQSPVAQRKISMRQHQSLPKSLDSRKVQRKLSLNSAKLESEDFDTKIQILMNMMQVLDPQCFPDVRQFHKNLLNHSLPQFYVFYVLKACLRKHIQYKSDQSELFDIKNVISKQIKETKNKQSHYHKIAGCWLARERLLSSFRVLISQKIQNESQVLQHKDKLIHHIRGVRLLTSNLIESVIKWRNSLDLQKCINTNFHFQDNQKLLLEQQKPIFKIETNLLMRILNDNSFVLKSIIANCVNMGTKNDPFFLSPLIKASQKSSLQYLSIFQLSREESEHYRKMMEYLASEKAYDMKMRDKPKLMKSKSKIQKIYLQQYSKAHSHQKEQDISIKYISEQNNEAKQNLRKAKAIRMKKSEKRISMIKAVYDKNGCLMRQNSNHSDDDIVEVVTAPVIFKKVPKVEALVDLDIQFDRMVEQRFKLFSIPFEKSVSDSKQIEQPKKQKDNVIETITEQQKMIAKVKNLNKQLREKLTQMNSQADGKQALYSPHRFVGKNSKQIVQSLKKQIVIKIQAEQSQKERERKRRKQEESKILQEIKQKMKKDIQIKLEQKKRQKLEEKRRLQQQLKQKQQKIDQQRQIQLEIILKNAKEKQRKNIERLKRQAQRKQKQLQKLLQREQQARKQQQQIVERERQQKQKLMKSIEIKQLKQQLHSKICRDNILQSRNLTIRRQTAQQKQLTNLPFEQPKVSNKLTQTKVQQVQIIGKQENKNTQILKQITLMKSKQQKQIQVLSRENLLRHRMLQLKLKQNESAGKDIQHLFRQHIQLSNKQLTDERGTAIKINTFNEQDEKQLIQVAHKMQQEEQIVRQREGELNKIKKQREIQQQMTREKIKQKIEKELRDEAVKRTKKQLDQREEREYAFRKAQGQIRLKMIHNIEIDKQAISKQQRSKILSSQFLSKQINEENAKTSLRSQFQKQLLASSAPQLYTQKEYLKVKNTYQYTGDQHLNRRMDESKLQIHKSQIAKRGHLQKNGVKEHIFDLTDEQLYIYQKQKKQNHQTLDLSQENRLSNLQDDPQYQQVDRIYHKQQTSKQLIPPNSTQASATLNKSKNRSKQANTRKSLKKQIKGSRAKNKFIKEPFNQRESMNSEESTRPKKESAKNNLNVIVGKNQTKQKKQKASQQCNIFQVSNQDQINKISTVPPVFNYKLNFQSIAEDELDQYLQVHFSCLPPFMTQVSVLSRPDLYIRLVNESTFSTVVGFEDTKLIGLAFIQHDRLAPSETRRFVIEHISTYIDTNLKSFILDCCHYIFFKDPCDEIQFKFIINEDKKEQKQFSAQLIAWWDQFGKVFQRKIQSNTFERKFIYRRQHYHKCEVQLNRINKAVFRNIVHISTNMLISKYNLVKNKQYLQSVASSDGQLSLDQVNSYLLIIAEMLRTYMTPQEAELLKSSIQSDVGFRQLLVLIVTLQKKKVKIEEYKLSEYATLVQLNMKLMSQGKSTIKILQDVSKLTQQRNQLFFGEMAWRGGIKCNFHVSSLPVSAVCKENKIKHTKQVLQVRYLRLGSLASHNFHILKSNLYNSQLYLLPTDNPKSKIFVMPGEEYIEIMNKQANQETTGMTALVLSSYLRLFLRSISKHTQAQSSSYLWVPQTESNCQLSSISEFSKVYKRQMYFSSSVGISYRQFIPSSLIVSPNHRDMVISVPFIVGVLSMNVESVAEGNPLFAKLCQLDDLKVIQVQRVSQHLGKSGK